MRGKLLQITNEHGSEILLFTKQRNFGTNPDFKAFPDGNSNESKKMKSVFGSVENIVGKAENAGYQHFLLLPQCFQKVIFVRVVKTRDCAIKSKFES